MKKKALFLDRDGVINIDKHYVHKPKDFEAVPGIISVLKKALKNKYKLIIITNQSGISRGYYSESDYTLFTEHIKQFFMHHNIVFTDIYHCPHTSEDDCLCRKPKPLLFQQAIKDHNVNPEKSWIIGDKKRDLEAAKAAGVDNGILVQTNSLEKLQHLSLPFLKQSSDKST
jgi:D-glycero-D-manno-heptose 1,7-bisphosphate phosphatase